MKGFIFEETAVCKLTVKGFTPHSTVGIFNQHDEPLFTGVVEGEEISIDIPKNSDSKVTVVVRQHGFLPFRVHSVPTDTKESVVTSTAIYDNIVAVGGPVQVEIDWDANPRLITVLDDDCGTEDIHYSLSEEAAKLENIHRPILNRAVGGQNLGNGIHVGVSLRMQNAEIKGYKLPKPSDIEMYRKVFEDAQYDNS